MGPPNISEGKRARKFKSKTPLDIVTYSPLVQKNSARVVQGGTAPHNVNLEPSKISETTRARMLKFKKKLDICEVLALVKKISALGGVQRA